TSVVVSILTRLMNDGLPTASAGQAALLSACHAISEETSTPDNQSRSRSPLHYLEVYLPNSISVRDFEEMPAEQKVRRLRELPILIANVKDDNERSILAFYAGYVISRVGGAERDLRLADAFGAFAPLVLTWAAVLGGLGVRAYWSDAFGG